MMGNSGIGYETVKQLAKQEAEVILACRRLDSGEQAKQKIVADYPNANVEVMELDLASLSSIRAFAQQFLDQGRPLHVLVNNAAIRPHAPFLEINEADWQRVIDVDLNAAIWLSRLVLPQMISNGWGRIISFSGMNAQRGYPGASSVAVAKHAVWGLTKSLAAEFGPYGITANIISPGTFPGDVPTNEKNPRFVSLLKENIQNNEEVAVVVELDEPEARGLRFARRAAALDGPGLGAATRAVELRVGKGRAEVRSASRR